MYLFENSLRWSNSLLNKDKIQSLWQTTSQDARFLGYRFGISEQSVRMLVRGLPSPHKKRRALTAFHRALGMKIIDIRVKSRLDKTQFALMYGMSHRRLSDLEKGYNDITITEIIKFGLLDTLSSMDTALLGDVDTSP